MNENAKNQLLELLKNLGCSEICATFKPESTSSSSGLRSTVVVTFPNGCQILGRSEGQRRSDADIAAAQAALSLLQSDYPNLLIDWQKIYPRDSQTQRLWI